VWVAPRRMRKSRTKKMDTAIGNFESALGLSRRRRHSTSAHRPETASVRARTNELRKKRKLSNCCLVGGGGGGRFSKTRRAGDGMKVLNGRSD